MSTPSRRLRHADENDRDMQDVLRRISAAPSTTPEANPEMPRAVLGELSGGWGEGSNSAYSLDRAPWKSIARHDELERLEASLRWLQREARATRLPRADLPIPLLAPFDAATAPDREPSNLRSPLSLEPLRLAPPPESNRSWTVPLAVGIACAVAAAVGYYASAGAWLFPTSAPEPRLQASAPEPIVTAALPRRDFEPQTIKARNDDQATIAADDPPAVPQVNEPQPASSLEQATTVAALEPGATASEPPPTASEPPPTASEPRPTANEPPPTASEPRPTASEPPPSKPVRRLDPGEIELLMQQAQQFVATGDLVTARILFQRAAQAGDAAAAVALGATYDPVVLAKLGVVGIRPDVEKARTWYRTAESLGSSEATQRLAVIANR